MFKEILTPSQQKLWPFVQSFHRDFGLGGGTAIALHIGHRASIDFDLFSVRSFSNDRLASAIKNAGKKIQKILVDRLSEYTMVIDGVKISFIHYPFAIRFTDKTEDGLKTPSLLTLAAMKAYALGRRAKWKDYVDLYFIRRDFFPLVKICGAGKKIFGEAFNEKIFRVQLAYFKDIDYTEGVKFRPGFEVKDAEIKKMLRRWSVED